MHAFTNVIKQILLYSTLSEQENFLKLGQHTQALIESHATVSLPYPCLCFKVAAKTVLPRRSPAVEFFEHDGFAGGASDGKSTARIRYKLDYGKIEILRRLTEKL